MLKNLKKPLINTIFVEQTTFNNPVRIYFNNWEKFKNLNKMTIETTTIEQTANDVLKTEAKTLYYLIVKNNKGSQLVINVGKKTHEQVKALNEEEKGGKQK